MLVSEAVGRTLVDLGVDQVFGVVGSGNFHVTNALVAGGARYVAARHETGAATMADAYARISRRVAAVSVHQGPGLTNALTGLTEAAKSRTPLIALAADVPAGAVHSNFHVDQDLLARAVGAVPERIHSAATAVADVARAYRTAVRQRRTVLLSMPLDVQAQQCPAESTELAAELAGGGAGVGAEEVAQPAPDAVAELTRLLERARRPVFLAGRGARLAAARRPLEQLADRIGALLSTSAVAKGMFAGNSWSLDVSGGFASPLAADLIRGADVIVAWGCSLTPWTTRHGNLIDPGAAVVQVDLDAEAFGRHRPAQLGVVGDVAATARAVLAELGPDPDVPDPELLPEPPLGRGYRTKALRGMLHRELRWRDRRYDDVGDGERIDPRTLTIALDDILPAQRLVATDSGNFMGYPSMYLDVPDDDAFCFTQAFQSIGLGLATAIGAGLARPDRLTVAALGDGGALMGIAELETAVRLGLPMVIVVYDDEAYGAEVHHFAGHPMGTVTFPPVDLAEIGRGFGCTGLTVRRRADLGGVKAWLAGPRSAPLLIDAKVAPESAGGSWWLAEAFRG